MIGRETDAADVERHADHGALLALGAGDERACGGRLGSRCRLRWRCGSRRRTRGGRSSRTGRSEEHTSELQSLMRISYAVFCLKKKIIMTRDKSKAEHR